MVKYEKTFKPLTKTTSTIKVIEECVQFQKAEEKEKLHLTEKRRIVWTRIQILIIRWKIGIRFKKVPRAKREKAKLV